MSELVWRRALQNFQTLRFGEAIADCELLVHQSPAWPMAFPLLSAIHLHLGQFKLASYYAVAATRHLDSLDWEGILSVSSALIMVGENCLAHEILLDIENKNFEPEKAFLHLGRQYSTLEDIPRALQAFESALHVGEKNAFVHLMYGLTCAHAGKFDEAMKAYDAALALEPAFAHAHWAKAQLGAKENARLHVEKLQAIFADKPLNTADRAYVDYAMYKQYERLAETDLAWLALSNGAKARRAVQQYDRDAEKRSFETWASAFSTGHESNTASMRQTPVFIVGMPRTGTTLLERILGNHEEMTSCGELTVMHQQLQWILDRPLPPVIDAADAEALRGCDFEELGHRYLQKTQWLTRGKKFFSDKNPMNFMYCGAILKALPQAKIIHMQRNPMDACFSNFKELFAAGYYSYSYDLEDCAAHYRNYRQLMQAWHALWPGKILDVRYEDLVRNPMLESRRIFEYLGLEHSSGLIEIENNKSVTTTASSFQVREGIHSRNVEGWKTYAVYLTGLQQDLLSEIKAYDKK